MKGWKVALSGKIVNGRIIKHVLDRDMSEKAINRRFATLAGLYDLCMALQKAGRNKVREPSARYKVRPKKLKPDT